MSGDFFQSFHIMSLYWFSVKPGFSSFSLGSSASSNACHKDCFKCISVPNVILSNSWIKCLQKWKTNNINVGFCRHDNTEQNTLVHRLERQVIKYVFACQLPCIPNSSEHRRPCVIFDYLDIFTFNIYVPLFCGGGLLFFI